MTVDRFAAVHVLAVATGVLFVAEERKVMAIIVLAEASVCDRASTPATKSTVVTGETTLVTS